MNEKELLSRVVVDSQVMAGKPVIKGTRLTVQFILGLLAQGMSSEEIVQEYGSVTKDDILACLMFAHNALADTTFAPLAVKV